MASNSALLSRSGQYRLLISQGHRLTPSFCPACANASRATHPRVRTKRDASSRRYLTSSANPRAELEDTLLQLQKQSPNLINLSRLQLALQGLRRDPGTEIIRVAILGLSNGSKSGPTARRILRSLLADPLQDEQPWEKELERRDETKPLIVRVGPPQQHVVSLEIEKETGLDEMHISSPQLDGYNLEFLLMEVNVPYGAPGEMSIKSLEDSLLVPTVNIPSAADRISPISTPVHQALLVADGLMGAVNISALPVSETDESITAAVQLEGIRKQLETSFNTVDVSLAEEGVRLFRQGPQNAREFERLWFSSNIPALTKWLKAGSTSAEDETKPAVRKLIASTLQNTLSEVQLLEARKLSKTSILQGDDPAVTELNKGLAEWAQKAHSELQDELDHAFSGRRWRKLGWWKLFWRVDDVAMLTNEMLSQRFLPTAEQELVYLTGRIAQLGGASPEYSQPKRSADAASGSRTLESALRTPTLAATSASPLPKWPGHIAFTRRYLQDETVPALQSLAQKLVVQCLGTSGVATSLAALLYISSFSSTIYEAGAVAALGIVYSLGRVQKKWDAARTFWEGEVREEGRKSVRAAEESVAAALEIDASNGVVEGVDELEKTKELVVKAADALGRMK
ncbi:hypothetical protein QQS21_003071 [Conoideocrella luteorostrata]|uniref:Mmc1 C-terminal domain-containing protein n=1 Tax=Conoideocrella luteorostrata TaxID=1105319 RepID=A0AAJ0CU10_9HYPO|nr:hypothetical protein QQS21_003071 [Conoideocrella luteorostrata]